MKLVIEDANNGVNKREKDAFIKNILAIIRNAVKNKQRRYVSDVMTITSKDGSKSENWKFIVRYDPTAKDTRDRLWIKFSSADHLSDGEFVDYSDINWYASYGSPTYISQIKQFLDREVGKSFNDYYTYVVVDTVTGRKIDAFDTDEDAKREARQYIFDQVIRNENNDVNVACYKVKADYDDPADYTLGEIIWEMDANSDGVF